MNGRNSLWLHPRVLIEILTLCRYTGRPIHTTPMSFHSSLFKSCISWSSSPLSRFLRVEFGSCSLGVLSADDHFWSQRNIDGTWFFTGRGFRQLNTVNFDFYVNSGSLACLGLAVSLNGVYSISTSLGLSARMDLFSSLIMGFLYNLLFPTNSTFFWTMQLQFLWMRSSTPLLAASIGQIWGNPVDLKIMSRNDC
jgi:hypothetical protein